MLAVVLLLAVIYMGIEAFAAVSPELTILRATLVSLGGVFLIMLQTAFVKRYFQLFVFFVFLIGGIAKTIMIDQSGEFGQTLFQLGVLLVLRVKFVHAVSLSVIDLTGYLIFSVVRKNNSVEEVFVYLLFLLGFGISGCYRLQARGNTHTPATR